MPYVLEVGVTSCRISKNYVNWNKGLLDEEEDAGRQGKGEGR
jgi:hypothetical protein